MLLAISIEPACRTPYSKDAAVLSFVVVDIHPRAVCIYVECPAGPMVFVDFAKLHKIGAWSSRQAVDAFSQ